jgi:hypothetical protein
MSGTTGRKCEISGIYRAADRCSKEIALSKGDTFPPCHNCRTAVTWILVRATR